MFDKHVLSLLFGQILISIQHCSLFSVAGFPLTYNGINCFVHECQTNSLWEWPGKLFTVLKNTNNIIEIKPSAENMMNSISILSTSTS